MDFSSHASLSANKDGYYGHGMPENASPPALQAGQLHTGGDA